MIKFIILILIFTLGALGLFWLSLNSGIVTLDIFGYNIESTVTIMVIVLLIGFMLIQLAFAIFYKFFRLSSSLKNYFLKRKRKEQNLILKQVVKSVLFNDYRFINKLGKKLTKFPDFKYFGILIDIDYRNFQATKTRLETLLNNKDYKTDALKQLIRLHINTGKYVEALSYVSKLWSFEKDEYNAHTYLKILMKLNEWGKSNKFLETEAKNYFERDTLNVLRTITNYKLAQIKIDTGDYYEAKELLITALRANDDFYPVIHSLIEIHLKLKELTKAEKLMRTYWAKFNSPPLTLSILSAAKEYTAQEFYNIVRSTISAHPQTYESHLLLAKAALDSDQFDIAFKEISESLSQSKNLRACLLMSEFCQRTHGNSAEVLNWLKQAMISKLDINEIYFYLDFDTWMINSLKVKDGFEIAKL